MISRVFFVFFLAFASLLGLSVGQPLEAASDGFVGNYRSIGPCTPSESCCCAVPNSQIEIREATAQEHDEYSSVSEPHLSSAGSWVYVSGLADGGAGCNQMSELKCALRVESTKLAEFTVQIEGMGPLTVNLTKAEAEADRLTLGTTASSCPIQMERIAA